MAATTGPNGHPEKTGKVIVGPFPEPPEDRWDVFISYSSADRSFAERIRTHLKPIENSGVKIFDYDMVEPGAVVRDEARNALSTSVVAVLLISADYIASDLIMNHDLPDLLERAEEKGEHGGRTRILRLNARTADLSDMPRLIKYQEVGAGKRPLDLLPKPEREVIYVDLLKAIKRRLKECGRYPKPEPEPEQSIAEIPEAT
jgi:hypothetical protein